MYLSLRLDGHFPLYLFAIGYKLPHEHYIHKSFVGDWKDSFEVWSWYTYAAY